MKQNRPGNRGAILCTQPHTRQAAPQLHRNIRYMARDDSLTHGLMQRILGARNRVGCLQNGSCTCKVLEGNLPRCKTLLIQNGRLLLRGVVGWSEDTETACPLCLQVCRAGALTEHVMLDCEALNAQRTSTLAAVHKIMQQASPPAAPESSARVAVPLPKALVQAVDACKQAAPSVPEAHRLTALRLLLCA